VAPEEEEWGRAEEELGRGPLPDEDPMVEVEESMGWRDCEAQCLGPLFPQSLGTCTSSGVTEDCREPDPGTEWDSVSPGSPRQEEEFNVLLLPEREIEEV
jgi:hypothetical protein